MRTRHPGAISNHPPKFSPDAITHLVERAKRGDHDAYAELMRRHEQRVFHIAYRILRCREDAEDIRQQVFLRVLLNLKNLEQPKFFVTWLHRVTLNCAITHYRQIKSAPMIREADLSLNETSLDYVVAAQALDRPIHRKAMDPIEIHLDLNQLLGKIHRKERRLLEMQAIEGLSIEEISRKLNLTVPSVKSRLYRSRILARRLSSTRSRMTAKHRNGKNIG